jgi:transposase-like protein
MSAQRFTPEFKEEAVKQVIERGYSAAEVAARLGVSTHSLYKWVKAASPDHNEQKSQELLKAKSEILRLRSQMRRIEEERDILKKPCGTWPGARVKYRFINEHRTQHAISLMCRLLRLLAQGSMHGCMIRSPLTNKKTDACSS